MFAAGPATNLFAAFICLILLGGLAGNFTSSSDNPHVRGIIKGEGADMAGMEPWDTILRIDGDEVHGSEGFLTIIQGYGANDTIVVDIRHENGSLESVELLLSDKYDYYSELGWSSSNLEAIGIEQGDAFVGVEGISESTAGIDRLAGPFSPRFNGGFIAQAIYTPIHILEMMILPFELQGVSMHPVQEGMLVSNDGILGESIGLSGLLFLVNFFFWLMWVNILLGFTNLLPMVPFDGGHLFKDWLNGNLNRIKQIGKKTKLWNLHPMWVSHISNKASSLSSIILLVMLLFVLFIPYV
tara:strand:- start:1961 stop:2854 length:894 start_codon:yes stop_codon:yes gene_type:complete